LYRCQGISIQQDQSRLRCYLERHQSDLRRRLNLYLLSLLLLADNYFLNSRDHRRLNRRWLDMHHQRKNHRRRLRV
jgi:hypothetical protein